MKTVTIPVPERFADETLRFTERDWQDSIRDRANRDLAERIRALPSDPDGMTPEEVEEFVAQEIADMRRERLAADH